MSTPPRFFLGRWRKVPPYAVDERVAVAKLPGGVWGVIVRVARVDGKGAEFVGRLHSEAWCSAHVETLRGADGKPQAIPEEKAAKMVDLLPTPEPFNAPPNK